MGRNPRHILVLEDDINIELDDYYFYRALRYIFLELAKVEWGIVRLGYHPNVTSVRPHHVRLYRGCDKITWGAFAYLLNGNYRERYHAKLNVSWRRTLKGHDKSQADNIMFFETGSFDKLRTESNRSYEQGKSHIPLTFHIEPRMFGHHAGYSDNWKQFRPPKRRLNSYFKCHC